MLYAVDKLWVFIGGQFHRVIEICPRLALIATVTICCHSTSNSEIIVHPMTIRLERHRVRQT